MSERECALRQVERGAHEAERRLESTDKYENEEREKVSSMSRLQGADCLLKREEKTDSYANEESGERNEK